MTERDILQAYLDGVFNRRDVTCRLMALNWTDAKIDAAVRQPRKTLALLRNL